MHTTTVVNGKVHFVALKDVLFVPKQTFNLIFVRSCRENDFRFTIDSSEDLKGVFTAGNVTTSCEAFCGVDNKENGLFEVVLRAASQKQKAVILETDTRNLWHARLSHDRSTTMKKTIPIVTGMDLNKCKMDRICPTCELCKYKSQPRPSRYAESKKAISVLYVMHCDLQGPISNPYMYGAKYFVVLLDDASDLSMVRLLNAKDSSRPSLQDMITQM